MRRGNKMRFRFAHNLLNEQKKIVAEQLKRNKANERTTEIRDHAWDILQLIIRKCAIFVFDTDDFVGVFCSDAVVDCHPHN